MPSISLGTVYRNLGILLKENEINKIGIEGGPDRYDRNSHGHSHLICDECGMLKDVKLEGIKTLLSNQLKVPVKNFDLNIHYICDDCKKKNNE